MLSKEKLKVSTLRLLLSSIKYRQIEKGEELDDNEIIAVLSTEVKKRRESAEEYSKAERKELAEKEEAEIKVIEKYLPEQMTDDEITKLIDQAIDDTGAESKKDMGKVMQQLMPKTKGRADGRKVSQIVTEKLGD
ncbi:MAG TPA: GatB/YqeY domain-containing protein [Actinobacteria bacterium]|nr:GatB/YqeY domain-containing protein [Actinomycetota bacterium]